jgi:hypothetical protein
MKKAIFRDKNMVISQTAPSTGRAGFYIMTDTNEPWQIPDIRMAS